MDTSIHNFPTGHNIAITPGVLTNSVSFDQVAAKHIGPTYLPSLLSWTSGVEAPPFPQRARSRYSGYQRLPCGLRAVFPPADPSELKRAKARIALNRSIPDTATDDVKALQRRLGVVYRREWTSTWNRLGRSRSDWMIGMLFSNAVARSSTRPECAPSPRARTAWRNILS